MRQRRHRQGVIVAVVGLAVHVTCMTGGLAVLMLIPDPHYLTASAAWLLAMMSAEVRVVIDRWIVRARQADDIRLTTPEWPGRRR